MIGLKTPIYTAHLDFLVRLVVSKIQILLQVWQWIIQKNWDLPYWPSAEEIEQPVMQIRRELMS